MVKTIVLDSEDIVELVHNKMELENVPISQIKSIKMKAERFSTKVEDYSIVVEVY